MIINKYYSITPHRSFPHKERILTSKKENGKKNILEAIPESAMYFKCCFNRAKINESDPKITVS
jgi:hypothetical protein